MSEQTSAAQLVGREAELSLLEAFLGSSGSPQAFVLTGGPGIGKTALWEAGIDAARQRGLRVLLARGSGAETRLSFAALIDLLDGVSEEELAVLPPPQRQVLEVALFRAESDGTATEAHAIAVGLLNALRSLAVRESLLVAVDDPQWLDSASADALAFVARRLDAEAVAFLLARRPGPASAVERALGERVSDRVELGPLSIGATRRMLSERFGLSLPRHVLRRVFESTLGNPLFALEVGRTLASRGAPALTEDLPVPDSVEDLLGTRVAQLTAPVRRLLLALALQGDLRVSQLTAIAEPDAVEDAVDAGVAILEGERVRPAHPLLAAAAKTRARPARLLRREHRREHRGRRQRRARSTHTRRRRDHDGLRQHRGTRRPRSRRSGPRHRRRLDRYRRQNRRHRPQPAGRRRRSAGHDRHERDNQAGRCLRQPVDLRRARRGFAAQLRIAGGEGANDMLLVQTLGGDDDVTVAPDVPTLITPFINLGAGE